MKAIVDFFTHLLFPAGTSEDTDKSKKSSVENYTFSSVFPPRRSEEQNS